MKAPDDRSARTVAGWAMVLLFLGAVVGSVCSLWADEVVGAGEPADQTATKQVAPKSAVAEADRVGEASLGEGPAEAPPPQPPRPALGKPKPLWGEGDAKVFEWDARRCTKELAAVRARIARVNGEMRTVGKAMTDARAQAATLSPALQPIVDEIARLREALKVKRGELARKLDELADLGDKEAEKVAWSEIFRVCRRVERKIQKRMAALREQAVEKQE